MKVRKVKAKVATKPIMEDAAFWKREAERNAELVKQLQSELDIEKKNHALATAGVQLWQKIAIENEVEARKWKAQVDTAQKEIDRLKVEHQQHVNELEYFMRLL